MRTEEEYFSHPGLFVVGQSWSGTGIWGKETSLNKDVQLRHIVVSLEKALRLMEWGGGRLEREEGSCEERPYVLG